MSRLKTTAEIREEAASDLGQNKPEDNSKGVTVSCGICKLTGLKLVGKKVGEVRRQLTGPLKIHAEFVALVNGEEVDIDYVLRENDAVEFVKLSGVKGKTSPRG